MNYNQLLEFSKVPRKISVEQAKSFLQNNDIGKMDIITVIACIPLAISSIIIFFFSNPSIAIPLTGFGALFISAIPFIKASNVSAGKLNKYPLSVGYLLVADDQVRLDEKEETPRGAIIIFTLDDRFRLDEEWITRIGKKVINKEIPKLDYLYKKMDDFRTGIKFFSMGVAIKKDDTQDVKVYYSYVTFDSRHLPDGNIPDNRILPFLIDDKHRGIAIPNALL